MDWKILKCEKKCYSKKYIYFSLSKALKKRLCRGREPVFY